MPSARRTVLITGATGNLGKAVASAFEEEGARLVLLGSRKDYRNNKEEENKK